MLTCPSKSSHFYLEMLVLAGGLIGFNTSRLVAEQATAFDRKVTPARRVEMRVETTGELKLLNAAANAPEEIKDKAKQAITRVPLSVNAQLRYQERPQATESEQVLSHGVRKYEIAEAKIRVGKGDVKNGLGAGQRLIVVQDTTDATAIFSPRGPLLRDELDLLMTPGDAGLLMHLLPEKPVAPGESWRPSTDVLARLLRWEVVNESDVSIKFNRQENGIAIFDIAGKASGGIEGIASDVELTGKLNYDSTTKQCTWFAATLKENRAASQGMPGFETTSRIRVGLESSELPAELADDALANLKTTPDVATRLLRYESKPLGLEFVYEPEWNVVSDQADLVVLRRLDRGDLVAQCNISSLPPLGKGEQLTLEGYQAHLKESLTGTFREFLEAGERVNENGVRVLRVVASGVVSEVPLQWVFYHLSDDRRHRVTPAITMDAENAEKFGRSEETLIDSFSFAAPTDTAQKPVSGKK